LSTTAHAFSKDASKPLQGHGCYHTTPGLCGRDGATLLATRLRRVGLVTTSKRLHGLYSCLSLTLFLSIFPHTPHHRHSASMSQSSRSRRGQEPVISEGLQSFKSPDTQYTAKEKQETRDLAYKYVNTLIPCFVHTPRQDSTSPFNIFSLSAFLEILPPSPQVQDGGGGGEGS